MKNIYTQLITKTKQIKMGIGLSIILVACQDFIDVGIPRTEITTATVFSSDASAISAIGGIYSKMMSNQSFTKGELERFTGIYSDELINYSSNLERQQFANASLLDNNGIVLRTFWGEAYSYISNANAILEEAEISTELSLPVKNQLIGEALFIRAFCHFYLVNLFGDVPFVVSTEYEINAKLERMATAQVYQRIVEDLLKAKQIMQPGFLFSDERIHPNRAAASALLARVYLHTSNWALAESEASTLIMNADYSLATVENTFIATSHETIWQLKPVIPGTNSPQALLFVLTNAPSSSLGAVSLRPNVVTAFEAGDKRKDQWIGTIVKNAQTYKFSNKYKVSYSDELSEYAIMFRLAEQYLIRAEARAHQDKLTEAYEDVNVIRNRAHLDDLQLANKVSLLAAIEKERVCELFTENGHRWLDLKRTNRATEVISLLKPDWQDSDLLFPIPNAERIINTNLTQNPGY
jgi:starch-binding outer membrane protein, SusD/RagB family